jgi:hypothetical protein
MTPEELSTIRSRAALYSDPEWRGRRSPKWAEVACDDAAALLSEVDRLTAIIEVAGAWTAADLKAEVDRLTAALFMSDERVALIREAVVELEGVVVNEWLTEDAWVSRDKVLNVIEKADSDGRHP